MVCVAEYADLSGRRRRNSHYCRACLKSDLFVRLPCCENSEAFRRCVALLLMSFAESRVSARTLPIRSVGLWSQVQLSLLLPGLLRVIPLMARKRPANDMRAGFVTSETPVLSSNQLVMNAAYPCYERKLGRLVSLTPLEIRK